MSLISLKGIGKIYVSNGNVAVGIRGVNLSFDKGEFVAITGESGSGKSTLLNVISGMDSYEEGEMFVEGEPTSHYVQQDWEEYRRNYISFIFQDYNIIESFTVLQNVELALMHIENPKERRERAVALLKRVGLERHLYHKGSKLSGGQKQRTVIARALAKDSPIILADEPTGNLDSQSSKEIIELLREVSKDKLVIIVTHNYEQVEDYATRHIRVFDSAIEADNVITKPVAETVKMKTYGTVDSEREAFTAKPAKKHKKNLANGLTLGAVRFKSTPKLTVFLCILMTLSALAMTFITSLSGDAQQLFENNYIFNHVNGRTVIIRQDGAIIGEDEIKGLAEKTGAESYLHYDYLLDTTVPLEIGKFKPEFAFSYGNFGKIDAGRAPAADNEIMLRVPVYLKPCFGGHNFTETQFENVFGIVDYTVTGVSYYYDNTVTPEMVFTESGYRTASALAYFANSADNFQAVAEIKDNRQNPQKSSVSLKGNAIRVSFDMDKSTYIVANSEFNNCVKQFDMIKKNGDIIGYDYSITTTLSGAFVNNYYPTYERYDVSSPWVSEGYGLAEKVSAKFDNYTRVESVNEELMAKIKYNQWDMVVSPDIICDFMKSQYYSKSYTQASLFYANDAKAESKTAVLKNLGYTAVPSSSTIKQNGLEAIIRTISLFFTAFGWVLAVVFITFFISLCSSRAMLATKGDIAILRSMGISTPVIKISIYVQTLIALIPAYIVTAIAAMIIFTVPQTNAIFGYLHAWEYVVITIAMLCITLLLSKRYVKKMFGSSVKKTLKGDAEE